MIYSHHLEVYRCVGRRGDETDVFSGQSENSASSRYSANEVVYKVCCGVFIYCCVGMEWTAALLGWKDTFRMDISRLGHDTI